MNERLQQYARELLLHRMHDISEDFWCAGWIGGLEYDLWDFVVGKTETYGTYVRSSLDDLDREHLKQLAEDAGGWYYYSFEPGHGEQFIAMDEWLKMYEGANDA